ncbi:MAG: hypothetical protein QMC83_01830 [Thermodesulfovibrionales bacterium]|nr:hypothetical protein [Thermodesulfovibrionales bacterium]
MGKKENEKEEEIRKLKEEIRKLKEAKAEGKEEESEGIVEGILKGVGGMIPGLEGLLKGVMRSPAFKEKLGQIEKEVERKIREAPLRRAEEDRGISIGIPPGVRGRPAKRYFVKERPPAEKPKSPPPKPEERLPDIFDEKDHIKVIAEIPGVEEKDINLNLQGDKLTISVDIPDCKYHQELKLPCEPKGKLEKAYKNGILEVKIEKS